MASNKPEEVVERPEQKSETPKAETTKSSSCKCGADDWTRYDTYKSCKRCGANVPLKK